DRKRVTPGFPLTEGSARSNTSGGPKWSSVADRGRIGSAAGNFMERLRGSAETTVDDKGRFKVPAVFRAPIEETFGNEFFVTSIEGVDVLVYPMPVWNAIEEKLAALPAVHRAKQKFLTRVNTFGGP